MYGLVKTQKAQYELLNPVGSGTGGQVYKAINRVNNQLVALKKQQHVSETESKAVQYLLQFQDLKHVIRIQDFDFCDGFSIIVMDLGDGSLFDLMTKSVLNMNEKLNYFYQVVEGVEELHKIGYIHRDLKPENVVFVQVNNQKILKLCDTGLMRDKDAMRKTSRIGTPYYMPPEQIQTQTYNDKVDIWALGQILFELIFGQNMFTGNSLESLLNTIVVANQEYINKRIDSLNCDQYLKNVLRQTIVIDSRQRLTATQMLNQLKQQQTGQNHPGQVMGQFQFAQQQSFLKAQQQRQEKEKAERLEQEKREQMKKEEERKRQEKEQQEIQERLEHQKRKEMEDRRIKDQEAQKQQLEQLKQELEEQKKREVEMEVAKTRKALDERNKQELALKEKEIKEKMEQLEQQNKLLQQQDLQKYNQEKMLMEIKKQNEIENFKQEQQKRQQEEIQRKEQEIKQQKEYELQFKLEQWKLKVKKEVEDQVRDKYQKQYEEQARNLKLKQLDEEKQLIQNKKDTLKSQMICVNVFVSNQIEFINQKKVEIQTNYDQKAVQVEQLLQQIDQYQQLLQSQQDFIKTEQNQLNLFTIDQVNQLLKEYETRLQLIKEQNQQQSQTITDLYQQIKKQQVENDQQRQQLQLQLNELQNKKNQKQQQSEYVTNTIYNQILLWEKKVKESSYAPQELLQQFEQIKETHEMTKAQIYQASQSQYFTTNDQNDQIQQIQTQIKQLENVIVTQNQIQQKLTYLQDFYQQQKIKYINSLEEQKINFLNQCSAYLEQAKLISQFESQIVFDQVKQFYNQTIQEIQQLNQLQQQVEELNFSIDLDDPKLQFNEKLLRQLQMDVEKKNTLILDYKNKFLTALQQQKEAQNVLQKCKSAQNQLLNQTNFEEQIQRQINQLNQIQAQVQSIVNPELNQLINQKHLNIKQKEQEIQALQIQLKSTFTSDMIKTEDQFQIVVKDFNLKINNLKNGIDSEIASISDLQYRVQQTLKQCKTKMDQEVSEISYFIDQELNKKLSNHKQNIRQLTDLNKLQQFEILKDNGLTKQIEILKQKVIKYEQQYQELREDLQLLQKEENQSKQSSFQDQYKKKMQQLEKISNQIYEYHDKLKKQVECCEKQQKDIKYYNDYDVKQLEEKLIKQIEQEEAQMQNYKIKLDELNNLQIEYQKGFNTNEILSKLKNQEQLYKSSIIAIQQINYEEEWQFQIQRLIPIKQQYQLCRCYILQSNIIDLERLCKRRFDKIIEKQQGDNSKVNLSDKRNKDLQDIQQIFKIIDENKSFLNQQADRLKINENDIDLTLEFQNIEQQVNQYQISVENAIKSNNLVKLRGCIKNQELIKFIQQKFMPHLEGNRMKLYEHLFKTGQQPVH